MECVEIICSNKQLVDCKLFKVILFVTLITQICWVRSNILSAAIIMAVIIVFLHGNLWTFHYCVLSLKLNFELFHMTAAWANKVTKIDMVLHAPFFYWNWIVCTDCRSEGGRVNRSPCICGVFVHVYTLLLCVCCTVPPPATSINTLMVLSMRVCTFPHILIGRPFIELNIAHTAISIKQQS